MLTASDMNRVLLEGVFLSLTLTIAAKSPDAPRFAGRQAVMIKQVIANDPNVLRHRRQQRATRVTRDEVCWRFESDRIEDGDRIR